MESLVYIVGAGDLAGAPLLIPEGAFVIAADGGGRHLQKAGILPDLIIGDFDSLGAVPEGENVICSPCEKDDTDMLLAVKKALSLGARLIVMLGGTGGRADHSLANLQTLSYIAARGAQGFLIGGGSVCTVIRDGGMGFSPEMLGVISVFSLSDTSKKVTIEGLKYPLTDRALTSDFPLGVSNEFIGTASRVSVKKGVLALIWQGESYKPGEYFRI